MGIITFNGISSEQYGIHVETPPAYVMPEHDYEVIHVPGRNGDIIIDKGSYKNVTRTYDISFGEHDGDFTSFASGIADWLFRYPGYGRLEDSYEPDYFRNAYYSGGLEIENIYHQAGRASLEFTCEPARYLKSGTTSYTFTSDGTLTNPTEQSSLPTITIYMVSSSGSVTSPLRVLVNGTLIVVTATSARTFTINSSDQTIYRNGYINNSDVVFYDEEETASKQTLDFPKLSRGVNTISFIGDVGSNRVTIRPNWWTL